jgi:DHA1 family multidrug resistance protein-like MFS transporter
MTKEVKRIIFVVLFCEFLICLGMSLIFPVEPFIKNEYHFTAFDMGVMSSLFAFVQFIACWSDFRQSWTKTNVSMGIADICDC